MKSHGLIFGILLIGSWIFLLYHPLPQTTQQALKADIQASKNAQALATSGSKTEVIKIDEYFDFNCPYCAKASQVLSTLKAQYGSQIQITYKHFNIYPEVTPVHKNMACAQAQNKGEAFHDLYFAQYFGSPSQRSMELIADQIQLDKDLLKNCLQDSNLQQQLDQDKKEGLAWGISGTPSLVINNEVLMPGLPRTSELQKIFDELLLN